MVNLMSRILQAFSDTNTFQGDPNMERVKDFPILVQEVNFGIKLPENVPRYAFESSSSCFTYSINDDKTAFSDESTLHWVRSRAYAPQQIDLKTVTSEELAVYAKDFVEGYCGLVYYYNMQPHSEEQLDNFSITSGDVFLTNVRWDGK